ncbi:MAG: DUF2723 domain-containing protein [Chloroflexota bacterium]|nr:DUF2723 domain-containing protein [Chloroflexota bacterium]
MALSVLVQSGEARRLTLSDAVARGLDSARRTLSRDDSRIAAGAVTAVLLVLYTLTLLPGVGFFDPGELQTVPAVLGITHPTGYPVYTLLGHLWSYLPFGSIAYKANLLSAACAAAAAGVGTLIASKLGARTAVAMAAMLLVGVSPTFWESALRAETKPLHVLFIALLLHRLVIWSATRQLRHLALGALLLGLSFGNHMLTIAAAPVIVLGAIALGAKELRARPAWLGVAALAFLVGISTYLYLPLRSASDPPAAYTAIDDFSSLVRHVSGQQFSGSMRFLSPAGVSGFVERAPEWLVEVANGPHVILLLGGLLGAVLVPRRSPVLGLVLIGTAAATLYVYTNYTAGSLESYTMSVWLVLGVLASVGWTAVDRWLRLPLAVAGAIGAMAVVTAAASFPAVDLSDNHDAARFNDQMLATLPPNAVLITYWDTWMPLQYAQLIEGRRTDVLVTPYSHLPNREELSGRPIFELEFHEPDLSRYFPGWVRCPVREMKVGYGDVTGDYTRWLHELRPTSCRQP